MAENRSPTQQRALHAAGRSGAEHLPVHHRLGEAGATVAGRRASGLPTSSKKPTIIATEEVRRGLVKYSLTGPAPEEPVDSRPAV